MIVCVCNGLSSSTSANLAGSGRCRGVGCMYRLQGARVRCGKCVPMMHDLYVQHSPAPMPNTGEVGNERGTTRA